MSNCVTKNKTEHGISKLSHVSAINQFLKIQWFSGFTFSSPLQKNPFLFSKDKEAGGRKTKGPKAC